MNDKCRMRKGVFGENKPRVHDLTKGKLFPQMVSFILPFAAANLLQTLYTNAALAIVGHFASGEALAAISVSGETTMSIC